jgi:hypothetical protein
MTWDRSKELGRTPGGDVTLASATQPHSPLAFFRREVVKNPALFEQLQHTPDTESFLTLIVELGSAHGAVFSKEEVKTALQAERQRWLEKNIL